MKIEERAIQVYQLLIAAADHRHNLTYETVEKKTGFHRVGIGKVLDIILEHCQKNGYPALPVLVVQKESGRPGPGFNLEVDIDQEQERVFAFEWYKLPPWKLE